MATRKVINKIIKDWQAYYIFWSGWADIEVDSALSTTSENPVQNKVITTELNKKANSNSLWTAASKDTWTSAWNVPLLNSNWKLDDSIIPAVAIVDTYAVTNKSDLLALSAQKWDVWIVSSESKSYILWGTGDPTVEANWLELKSPTWGVTSVNWYTWVVVVTDDTAFGASWDWDTNHSPSKNAIYDVLGDVETLLAAL